MLLGRWHTTVTRIRPGTKTERGSSVFDWENADEKDIEHCLVQMGDTILSQDGRVLGISDDVTLCAPHDADIVAGDRIVYEGKTYIMDGDPIIWDHVDRLNHMQVRLKRWRG